MQCKWSLKAVGLSRQLDSNIGQPGRILTDTNLCTESQTAK